MTPAIKALDKLGIPYTLHQYDIAQPGENYGQDVADALGVAHNRLFKTLLVSLNGDAKNLAVCIVPVSEQLVLKAAAKAHQAKKATMADPVIAETTTGYVVGGISPFGQKKRLPMVLDDSALSFETIFTSGGKRGIQIEFDPKALLSKLNATSGPLIQPLLN